MILKNRYRFICKTYESNGSNYIVSKNKKRIEITYKGGICRVAENNNEKRKSVRYMLFKRYKYLELEKTDIGNDEHNYYETVWYIRAYNNKRAYDNRNNTETSKSLDSNGKKKEKKKSRIIVKIIRDSYGNVTRVFVEPKAKKKKEVVDMAAAAYQSLLAME